MLSHPNSGAARIRPAISGLGAKMIDSTLASKIFVSYSHDSDEHKDNVLGLCNQLAGDGLTCVIDQELISPEEGWPRWMIRQIESADFVLVVATEEYERRFLGKREGAGKGANWEGTIITQEIYEQYCRNKKFVPIVFRDTDAQHIPIFLKSATHFNVTVLNQYLQLIRLLTGQPPVAIRKPKKIRRLSPRKPKAHHFDKGQATERPEPALDVDLGDCAAIDSQDDGCGQVCTITTTGRIELKIDRDFETYTLEEQQKLLEAIGKLMDISDTIVVERLRGSVRLILELPVEKAEELLWIAKRGDLSDFGVFDAVPAAESRAEFGERQVNDSVPRHDKACRSDPETKEGIVRATSSGLEITEVRIKLMEEPGERLKAFCSITFDDCFVVRDLKIIEGTSGPFVAMPSRKLTSHCQRCGMKNHLRAGYCNQCGAKLEEGRAPKDADGRAKLYDDIAYPINSDCREMIQERVINEYFNEIEFSKQPGYVSRYDDFDFEYNERVDFGHSDRPLWQRLKRSPEWPAGRQSHEESTESITDEELGRDQSLRQ